MFAKYWRAGEVKTRLGKTIGLPAAAAVHRQFVQAALRRFGSIGDQRVLAYSPAGEASSFAEVTGDAWRLQPQATGNLGDRIAYYFAHELSGGAASALLIGSDSPNLPAEYLRQAFRQLQDCDVVIGPAEDGGYYLIGLNIPCEALFADIAWSTADVFAQTMARCQQLGLRTSTTPTWYDVDTQAELERLQADLSADDVDPDLLTLRTELNTILADCPPL